MTEDYTSGLYDRLMEDQWVCRGEEKVGTIACQLLQASIPQQHIGDIISDYLVRLLVCHPAYGNTRYCFMVSSSDDSTFSAAAL